MSEQKKKKKKLEPYIDAEGNRRDPNRAGHPILCNGTSRRTGKPCGNIAMKNGKCRVHGGKATGPRTEAGKQRIREANSKHKFKTGEYVPIWYDSLTMEEKDMIAEGRIPKDAERLLNEQIAFLAIRERRMMKMILELESGMEVTQVQESWKRRLLRDEQDNPMVQVREDGSVEKMSEYVLDSKLVIKQDVKDRIQAIEDALTRVQQQKIKLIELKHKLEEDEINEDDGSLDSLVAVIAEARNLRKNSFKS